LEQAHGLERAVAASVDEVEVPQRELGPTNRQQAAGMSVIDFDERQWYCNLHTADWLGKSKDQRMPPRRATACERLSNPPGDG